MMDAGCYCAHTLRFFPGCSRPHVTSATAGGHSHGSGRSLPSVTLSAELFAALLFEQSLLRRSRLNTPCNPSSSSIASCS
jgi:hypothetical protein